MPEFLSEQVVSPFTGRGYPSRGGRIQRVMTDPVRRARRLRDLGRRVQSGQASARDWDIISTLAEQGQTEQERLFGSQLDAIMRARSRAVPAMEAARGLQGGIAATQRQLPGLEPHLAGREETAGLIEQHLPVGPGGNVAVGEAIGRLYDPGMQPGQTTGYGGLRITRPAEDVGDMPPEQFQVSLPQRAAAARARMEDLEARKAEIMERFGPSAIPAAPEYPATPAEEAAAYAGRIGAYQQALRGVTPGFPREALARGKGGAAWTARVRMYMQQQNLSLSQAVKAVEREISAEAKLGEQRLGVRKQMLAAWLKSGLNQQRFDFEWDKLTQGQKDNLERIAKRHLNALELAGLRETGRAARATLVERGKTQRLIARIDAASRRGLLGRVSRERIAGARMEQAERFKAADLQRADRRLALAQKRFDFRVTTENKRSAQERAMDKVWQGATPQRRLEMIVAEVESGLMLPGEAYYLAALGGVDLTALRARLPQKK
jgi:hypothetical protein